MMLRWSALLLLLVTNVLAQEAPSSAPAAPNLSERYPVGEIREPCGWTFESDDIFRISSFNYEGPDGLRFKTGPSDLGIGHCEESGAVWAVVIPRKRGQLVSSAADRMELLDHIWIRFHPGQLNELFPPETVKATGQTVRRFRMERIAKAKMRASYHKGMRALVPPTGTYVFDADTVEGKRRSFVVDQTKNQVQYLAILQKQVVPPVRLVTQDKARQVVERVWKKFDETYAGFGLRPKVDWAKARKETLGRVGEVSNTIELGQVLVEMLAPLRDLHVWVRVDDEVIATYRRRRATNGNRLALKTLVPALQQADGDLHWGRTVDGVAYIAIGSLRGGDVVETFDRALETLREADALVIDLRFNGGGNERIGQKIAGRFTSKPFVYASSRVRNGPKHDDLTDPQPRTLEPRGPWTFDKPVYVLIGQRCMSSAEALAGMFGEMPHAKLLGDRTAGSSGNPEELDAGEGIVVSVPRWVAYRADGETLDERGIEPDHKIDFDAKRMVGRQDPVLRAALRWIKSQRNKDD